MMPTHCRAIADSEPTEDHGGTATDQNTTRQRQAATPSGFIPQYHRRHLAAMARPISRPAARPCGCRVAPRKAATSGRRAGSSALPACREPRAATSTPRSRHRGCGEPPARSRRSPPRSRTPGRERSASAHANCAAGLDSVVNGAAPTASAACGKRRRRSRRDREEISRHDHPAIEI